MSIYRIHIRPKGGLANPEASFRYCLKEQVLGVGWQTAAQKSGISWDEYEKVAAEIYGSGELSRVRYLKDHIESNDLLWTRDTKGNYYLAKVLSEWEYYTNKEARDADITNVVRCKIFKIQSVDDVPGKVVACFQPSRTVQRIRDSVAQNYSRFLWNQLSTSNDYEINADEFRSIFTFLDSEQTEDIIFIYLQTKGWIVVPNSRKADTMSYEFYLIRKDDHRRAIVQVKTGRISLHANDWEERIEHVFLFQPNSQYQGLSEENVECIEPKAIEDFIYSNLDLMPENISHWAKIAKGEI